jgi:hypothetical protein
MHNQEVFAIDSCWEKKISFFNGVIPGLSITLEVRPHAQSNWPTKTGLVVYRPCIGFLVYFLFKREKYKVEGQVLEELGEENMIKRHCIKKFK